MLAPSRSWCRRGGSDSRLLANRSIFSAAATAVMLTAIAGCGNDAPPGAAATATPISTAPPGGGAVPQNTVVVPQPMTSGAAAQPTVRNEEYEKNLQKQTLQRAYDEVVRRYTQGKMAIVVINGVGGVEADANHYLERKLFKAAYADYQAGQQRAQQQTEANRTAAAQQAQAEHRSTWGGFGPQTVWYRYARVESDTPYPSAKGGSYGGGQFIYYVGPVLDLNQFATRLSIGAVSIDANSRTIVIQSALPVPVPDIDVEELYIQHGRESVVMMDIINAEGDTDDVSYFLETEVQNLSEDKTKLTVVGPRLVEPGKYRLYIAPVKSINAVTSRITFGSIADLNPAEQSVLISAKLPAELAEIERQRWEGNKRPKAGESEIDWAIRVLTKSESGNRELDSVLPALAIMDVDDERKEEVGKALAGATTDTWAWHNSDEFLRAMETWMCPPVMKELERMLMERHPKFGKEKILEVLGRCPSEDAAKAAARMMTDGWHAKNASAALREMGPVAEPVVLKLATDRHPTMRVEAYDILTEIGTSKGLAKLKSLVIKEKVKEARELLKQAIEELEERLQEEAGESAATESDSKA